MHFHSRACFSPELFSQTACSMWHIFIQMEFLETTSKKSVLIEACASTAASDDT